MGPNEHVAKQGDFARDSVYTANIDDQGKCKASSKFVSTADDSSAPTRGPPTEVDALHQCQSRSDQLAVQLTAYKGLPVRFHPPIPEVLDN